MLWWISLGIVVLALLVLVGTAVSVAGRMRKFRDAAHALQVRLLDGQQRVEPRLLRLQQTVEAMAPQLESMAQQAAARQAERPEAKNS